MEVNKRTQDPYPNWKLLSQEMQVVTVTSDMVPQSSKAECTRQREGGAEKVIREGHVGGGWSETSPMKGTSRPDRQVWDTLQVLVWLLPLRHCGHIEVFP